MAGVHSSSSSLKAFFVSFCLLLFCVTHVFSNVAVEFSMDLNHGDSPLHNPASINGDLPLHDPNVRYSFKVELIDSSFVVKDIIIGRQKKKYHVIISTASNLNWVLCVPCTYCYETYGSIFNPRASTSYNKIKYISVECFRLPAITRNYLDRCWFTYKYADDTWIDGVLSEEKLRLQSTTGELGELDFIFGCIHTTHGSFSKAGIGFMGLGMKSSSFAALMRRTFGTTMFSYCLPISNTTVGWLRFGSATGVSGPGVVTTPLVDTNSNLYKARLESIRVQGAESDPILIKQGDNIVIDSATQASYIDPEALKKLKNQVMQNTHGLSQKRALENDLCYDISKEEKPVFPWITFIFHGYGEINLNHLNAFATTENPEVVCLAFKSNELSNGVSIFGNLAQMGLLMEIDPNNKLTMLEGQCHN